MFVKDEGLFATNTRSTYIILTLYDDWGFLFDLASWNILFKKKKEKEKEKSSYSHRSMKLYKRTTV